MRVCFLVSGNGGNLKFFDLAIKQGILSNVELAVVSDRECNALQYALLNNIDSAQITYDIKYNQELIKVLNRFRPDYIVTTWYKILDAEVVNMYSGKMVNLHYSLLPAFSGLIGVSPIIKSLENNCQYIGVTCHEVDTGVDSGRIVSQSIIKKEYIISEKQLITKVFRKGCLILLNSLILLSKEEIILQGGGGDDFTFSPNLLFDDKQFNCDFWRRLSSL